VRTLEIAALAVSVVAVLSAATLHAAVRRASRQPRTWLIGVPASILVFAVGLPFLYTRVIIGPPPAPLSFADLPAPVADLTPAPVRTQAPSNVVAVPAATAAPVATASVRDDGPFAGDWKVGTGSQAGYSIDDTVMGQTTRVVGRTTKVIGSAVVVGNKGMSAEVVVDMASVLCNCVHDDKYREMLEVETYPTSSFRLTSPIAVKDIPPPGTVVTIPVKGKFTIHGVTRDVSFPLKVTQQGKRIAVNGSIPVKLEDYEIENPDAGAFGGLSNAAIDLLLAFERA
jgi:polyisoprenoid-binding protein YceI